MPREKQNMPLSGIVEITAYTTAGLIIVLAGLSKGLKIPFLTLLIQIKESYFLPYVNSANVGAIKGIPFHIYVYGAIGLLGLMALFIRFMAAYRQKKRFSIKNHLPVFSRITGIVFILIVGLQAINQVKVLRNEIELFGRRSTQTKQSFIHLPYDFASYCVGLLSGRHRCEFITDKDITRDPHMLRHREFAYFLFPTIDIRGIYKDRPIDCLIISKENAAQEVPEGFAIKGAFDPSNILAVKKEPNDI